MNATEGKMESMGFRKRGTRYKRMSPQEYLRKIVDEVGADEWGKDQLAIIERAIERLDDYANLLAEVRTLHETNRRLGSINRQLMENISQLERGLPAAPINPDGQKITRIAGKTSVDLLEDAEDRTKSEMLMMLLQAHGGSMVMAQAIDILRGASGPGYMYRIIDRMEKLQQVRRIRHKGGVTRLAIARVESAANAT